MENPYQVSQPSHESAPATTMSAATRRYPFRPPSTLTPILRLLYALLVPLMPALAVVGSSMEDFDEQGPVSDMALLVAIVAVVVGLGSVVIFISTVIIHCVWTNRMNKNARALGAQGMEYTPGWAVGWFFVPIANLYKPFSVASEIYRASAPGPDGMHWKDEPTPGILNFWWACWIIGFLLDRVSGVVAQDKEMYFIISLLAGLAIAASAAGAFVWVGHVHRLQMQTFASLQQPHQEPRPFENW